MVLLMMDYDEQWMRCVVFFFQAEDGIRDRLVTGVQTCALPILVALLLRTLPLPERVLLVIDDSPTKRYGPKVEGADVHHNPTPGPADQPFLYGHVWVTISLALRHPEWGPLALPLRAMLYVRRKTMPTIPKSRRWQRFATKLQLAARLVEWIVPILKTAGKTVWIVKIGRASRSERV